MAVLRHMSMYLINHMKKLENMIKKLYGAVLTAAMIIALLVLAAPCLLIFCEGNDGNPTVWNFVGIAWLVGLAIVFKMKS